MFSWCEWGISLNELRSKNEIINLDELITIPTRAEERSMSHISFRTQGPNLRQAQSGIRAKIHS